MSNNILRKARKAANLTQAELAKLLGVNRATISKYESGEISPPVDRLKEICNVLDLFYEDPISMESRRMPPEIHQSMNLDDYLNSFGYKFYIDYPNIDSETWLCVDNNQKKLYILPNEDLSMFEKSIHDYIKFQMSELLKKGQEIPDTDGWFKK